MEELKKWLEGEKGVLFEERESTKTINGFIFWNTQYLSVRNTLAKIAELEKEGKL